jgi:hypothetical protein
MPRRPPAQPTVRSAGGDPAAPRAAQLVLVAGPEVLITRRLDQPIVLGRDEDCDVVIDSPKVSRKHASRCAARSTSAAARSRSISATGSRSGRSPS